MKPGNTNVVTKSKTNSVKAQPTNVSFIPLVFRLPRVAIITKNRMDCTRLVIRIDPLRFVFFFFVFLLF